MLRLLCKLDPSISQSSLDQYPSLDVAYEDVDDDTFSVSAKVDATRAELMTQVCWYRQILDGSFSAAPRPIFASEY